MKIMLHCQNFAAAGLLNCNSQRIFVCFGTAVDQKHPIKIVWCKSGQFIGGRGAYLQRNRIALKE